MWLNGAQRCHSLSVWTGHTRTLRRGNPWEDVLYCTRIIDHDRAPRRNTSSQTGLQQDARDIGLGVSEYVTPSDRSSCNGNFPFEGFPIWVRDMEKIRTRAPWYRKARPDNARPGAGRLTTHICPFVLIGLCTTGMLIARASHTLATWRIRSLPSPVSLLAAAHRLV